MVVHHSTFISPDDIAGMPISDLDRTTIMQCCIEVYRENETKPE
jgi:hypothetical protein